MDEQTGINEQLDCVQESVLNLNNSPLTSTTTTTRSRLRHFAAALSVLLQLARGAVCDSVCFTKRAFSVSEQAQSCVSSSSATRQAASDNSAKHSSSEQHDKQQATTAPNIHLMKQPLDRRDFQRKVPRLRRAATTVVVAVVLYLQCINPAPAAA